MHYINELEKLNITHKKFNEGFVKSVIENEYPFCRLLEYSVLFDKYTKTDKKGTFVNLDFEQLYAVARIDEELSSFIICAFLEIERVLKARLLTLKNRLNISDDIVKQYIQTDTEFLNKTYTPENRQVLIKYSKPIEALSIEEFLDVIQFGTFQRFCAYIYNTYTNKPYEYDNYIKSAYRLRNKAAHCEAIITQLKEPFDYGTQSIVGFLREKGIKHKTLTTNMSKALVFDFCNIMYLYCGIEPKYKIERTYKKLSGLLDSCKQYTELFAKNSMLVSVYRFMREVAEIFKNGIN